MTWKMESSTGDRSKSAAAPNLIFCENKGWLQARSMKRRDFLLSIFRAVRFIVQPIFWVIVKKRNVVKLNDFCIEETIAV